MGIYTCFLELEFTKGLLTEAGEENVRGVSRKKRQLGHVLKESGSVS